MADGLVDTYWCEGNKEMTASVVAGNLIGPIKTWQLLNGMGNVAHKQGNVATSATYSPTAPQRRLTQTVPVDAEGGSGRCNDQQRYGDFRRGAKGYGLQ